METPILVELHSTLSLRQKLWLLCRIYFRKFLNIFTAIGECINKTSWLASRVEVAQAVRSGDLILDRDDYQTVVYCGKCNYSFATTGTHTCGKCGLPGIIDHYIGSEGDAYIDMPVPTPDNQHLFQNSFNVSCNYYVDPMPMASYYVADFRPKYIDLRWDTYADDTTFRKAQGEVDYNA